MDDDDFNSYDFDKILAKIQEESLRHYNEVELPRAAALKEQEKKTNLDVSEGDLFKSKVTIKDGNSSFTDFSESLFHHGEDADGFHYAAGKTYIYPSNYPVRKYQADIVPTALFHNTLVSLPTGLGKTFIAAVVMYNFYRWYPMGKVIFMAPTRPLVTQQLSACRDIMGIPVEDTVELTGSTTSGDRKLLWNSKRVFYLTPQVLMNDLRSNLLQASTIKCLVIDEAHRATKGYAYCQVVKILFEENVKFRILALSASPGTDANAVKDVILNLHIEKLEIRSDDSADVVEYSHTKSVIPIIVDLPAFLRDIWSQYMEVYDNYVRKIKELKVLNQNIATMSKFQILTAFRKFSSRPPSTLPKNVVQSINGDFTSCITLAHGRELLQTYGLRTFHSYFTDAENSNDKAASITRLSHDSSFRKLLGHIEKIIFKEDNGDSRQYNWSHPKMEHLVSVVREHFEVKALAGENTKAIIFCQYRLVVTEVYEILKKFVPQAKPVMFIGQSSKEKGQGLPQKKQIEVMKMFRSGEYNVMIATSVAEEGLDIGDVDLIVSMETHRSPIKLVQRFGRTGRKRNGRCVVLLTSGAEVKKFNEVMSTQKNYSSIISSPGVRASLEESSPRMIPQNCNPKLQLLHIKVPKSDKRKQCDIRNVFGKFDTSKTHASSAAAGGPSVPSSAFLTDDEMAQVRDELGSYFPNLNRLPESCELWPRQRGNRLEIEEFASNKFSGYSDWLDWSNELQETHVVGHSRDTKMLVDLLKKASEIKERTDEPVHNFVPSPPASLWSTVGANPNQKKRNEVVKKTKTNGKNQPKSKHGLDIRDCMARVPPPRLGFISQYSTMEDEFLTANKKQATYRNYQDLSAIHEADDVIIIDDDLDRISGDILSDFPELFGQASYCALSRNKDIRSVVLKCVNLPVKYELNLENFPDICELFEGITIEDVENLDLNELPCFKSISSSNKLSDFENVKKYSGFERIGRYSGASMYNYGMDFENIEKYSDVKRIDGYSSSPMKIEDTEKYPGAERVDECSSTMKELVKYENNKKESNIDIEDEDTCMSTESFIVGIDDIFKAINVDIEKDEKSPLKDPTNLDSLKDGCNGFEEKNLSPILSQRPKKIVKVFNGKELGNLSNSDLRENDDDKVGGCRVDENELSPILSQKPQKNLKGFKVSNFNSLKDVQLECGRAFEEKDLSPILSQKPQKMLKGLNEKCFNESNLNSCKNVNVDCSSGFEKEDFSPILSQMPQKAVKGSSERCKRKIEVENVSQPKCSKNVDQNLDPYFNDDQEFDEAFLDEFSVEMLNKLSPILSCKTQTFKKPESRCKNKETEQELSPILSQVSGKKRLSKFGESVGEDRIPNLTSSTPKCVKKDLFQNRLQNVTKFNLPQVQEVDTCKNRNLVEVENKEESKEDENEEEEEVWGIDQILGSSKCDEEKSSTVIDPTPPHSPKRLSYYMKGNSLYSVTQLVEKASKLEQNKVIEKEGSKQNKMNEKEVGDEIDEFIINSSDDDFFECADSKIDLNIEAEKRVQQMDVLINKSNQSLIEISDESQPPSNKNNTGNENSFVKTEKVSNDDDDDYFEITGLDELMQNCMSNLEKSKSKASTSVAHSKTSEFNMETDMMDSEVDELIENCLDDDFVNSLGKIESLDIDSKVSVEKSKSTNSCRSKFETDKSTTKDNCNKVSDLPNKTEKCSTQFKSDYLSNEELEELLKSGVFNESPIISSYPKLGTTQVNLVDKDENAMNDTEIIDDSNELYLESPLLLSYGSRSDRGLRNTMKSDCLKNNTKFSFLSKSKSKGVLKSGKETQLKPSSASTSRAKESFCGSSGKEIGRKDVKIKDNMPKSDDTFSGGSPDVKGATQENNETKQKIMDDTFSWGSLSIIGARQDNILTNPKILDERVCLEDVTACRKDIETKCKKSDDSFSWETRDMRGYGLEDSRKESNNLNPSTSATNHKSLVHIDDDSFVSGIKNHCKRRKQKIILSGSSTDMEEDSLPSIHTTVERENGEVKKFVKQSTDFESRKSTSFKAPNSNSDSDDSSDIFIVSMNKKSDRSHDDSGAVPSKGVDGKSKKSKKKKANVFIESEADVSGTETSSGKETSGLDSLDESFVDDNINGDNTMMVAHYLQTVKNPKNVAGGFRIPELSESIMARDVYSQYVPMEHETYVNDSFCVNESDSNDESKMSVLEIAEKLLEKRKKSRKNKKAKRKRKQTSSESANDFHPISSQESGKSEEISRGKKRKKRRIVILDDSDD